MNAKQKAACSDRQVIVKEKDLPLACPGDNAPIWSAHPRVFLPIEETGQEVCPYCGTLYILEKE